jgi:lipopolysaccharide transport protein LptA
MLRHWPVLICFVFGSLFVLIKSYRADNDTLLRKELIDKDSAKQYFFNTHYFLLEQERGVFDIKAKSAELADRDFSFIFPDGTYTGPELESPFNFKAEKGVYTDRFKRLRLVNDVQLRSELHQLDSDIGVYDLLSEVYRAYGNVKSVGKDAVTRDQITVRAERVEAFLNDEKTVFKGSVQGQVKLKRKYLGYYTFSADEMYVLLNSSKLELFSNIVLRQGKLKIYAQKSEIFLQNLNKKLKYYVFSDDVIVEQRVFDEKLGREITRKAFSEKLEGFENGKKVVLTGAPKVIQGADVIKGTKIVLREQASLVEVDNSKSSIIYRGNER